MDFTDYSTLADYWMETGCDSCAADLNCDSKVDFFDLREFTANWLAGLE